MKPDFSLSEIDRLRKSKNDAYEERNRLVALLAAVYPSSLERHPEADKDWLDEWRWIAYIDLPTGQASWHIHDSQLGLFSHVSKLQGRVWDGHTTEEKYNRISKLIEEFKNKPLTRVDKCQS